MKRAGRNLTRFCAQGGSPISARIPSFCCYSVAVELDCHLMVLSRSHRALRFESLEARLALSAAPLFDSTSAVYPKQFSISTTTGEKPQSKIWEQDGTWFCVLPDSKGTWVRRLDGNNWTSILRLTPEKA